MATSQPLKRHGGKYYLAKRIIERFPPLKETKRDGPFRHYVEPYFGAGAVLFVKPHEQQSEVINDVDGQLMNFWTVLRDHTDEFRRRVCLTPFSEEVWERSANPSDDPIESAVRMFVRCRQSRAALGKDFATMVKTRPRRGMQDNVSAYLSAVDGLAEAAMRLQRVVIFNRDALRVINDQDGPFTLFYLDPPYLHETRVSTGSYQFEMSDTDHMRLLEMLKTIQGRAILSGYPSDMYDQHLCDWRQDEIQIPNQASGSRTKEIKTEVLWMNYDKDGERL